MILRLRRDPGLAFVVAALVLAALIYAPTLGRGLVNHDDPWLVADNYLLQHPSWASLHAIFCDLESPHRYALGVEYLPVRDLSIMADFAVWGRSYGGFHLTSLAIYLASIALWFAALERFGIDRRVAGLAMLVWAIHPSHAESVAWLAERKGVLGMMFAGACALGFAQFRAGRTRWLAFAMIAAVAAIWSKAPSAFAIAALAGLELVLPERRVSWKRSLVGLGAIAAVSAAAFVPVLVTAFHWSVVATDAALPASRLAMVLGTHGVDLQLAPMAMPNPVSYPIATDGPTVFQLVLGALGLVAAIVALAIPRRPELRAGAIVWLFGWLPASHLLLSVSQVVVADRYLLVPSLGLALVVATGVMRIGSARARGALVAAIVLASAARTLDAQASWRGGQTLWARAVESNPHDGDAWSMYVEALEDAGQPELAHDATLRGLTYTSSPRLLMHEGLVAMRAGDPARARDLMTRAAEAGEPRAMSNLAKLLLDDGRVTEALGWARRATLAAPAYVNGQRIHGKVALAAKLPDEALVAFERAYAYEPQNLANRYNLALALIDLHRPLEARPHLEACVNDPDLGARARAALAALP